MFPSLLILLACGTSVAPGHVALQVNVTAEDDASRYTVLHGGRYFAGVNTTYYDLPTVEQRAVWCKTPAEGGAGDDSITFAGKDGQPVNVDVGIGYEIATDDADVVHMVKTYGYDLHLTIEGRVRDTVRNALNLCASEYTVEDIYGPQKGPLMACALEKTKAEYEPNGLRIHRLTLNSEVRLPDQIKKAMEQSNAAIQQAAQVHNEVASATAEGEKSIATATAAAESLRVQSEAQANANKILSASITPELIELKRIEVQKAMVEKWDGRLPQNTFGSDATPLITLPSPDAEPKPAKKKE